MSKTFPLRCFSCGKNIHFILTKDYLSKSGKKNDEHTIIFDDNEYHDYWKEYDHRVNNMGEDPNIVLDDMMFRRFCCRRMFLSHAPRLGEIMDMYDDFRPQYQNPNEYGIGKDLVIGDDTYDIHLNDFSRSKIKKSGCSRGT